MTLPSFDLLLQHKALDLVLITCFSFPGQKTKFRVDQPLLSLQLKGRRGTREHLPLSSPPHYFYKSAGCRGTSYHCRYVSMWHSLISGVLLGLAPALCHSAKGEGRAHTGETPVLSLSQISLLSLSLQAWPASAAGIPLPLHSDRARQGLSSIYCPLVVLSLTTRLKVFKGQKISWPFSDLVIFRL